MDYINSTPAADGFRMPAEFERHQGCIMIWPERPGSWAYGAKAAKKAFAQIASVISESEQVYMIVSEGRKEEAAKMMQSETDYIVLDVRTEQEYASGHIPGAVNIPNETIASGAIQQLPDKEQLILVYCRSGNRSKQASEKLVNLGYTNIVEFGGINDWSGEVVTQ